MLEVFILQAVVAPGLIHSLAASYRMTINSLASGPAVLSFLALKAPRMESIATQISISNASLIGNMLHLLIISMGFEMFFVVLVLCPGDGHCDPIAESVMYLCDFLWMPSTGLNNANGGSGISDIHVDCSNTDVMTVRSYAQVDPKSPSHA